MQATETEDHQAPAAKRRRLDASAAPPSCSEPACSRSCTPGAARGASPGPLASIPAELLSRVLSFLSAEDLTAVAPTCKLFQHATAAGTLWRRLHIARCSSLWIIVEILADFLSAILLIGNAALSQCRWGSRKEDVDTAKEWARPPTWKVPHGLLCNLCKVSLVQKPRLFMLILPCVQERYMERDTIEMQEVCKSVSELLRPLYAQVWLCLMTNEISRALL